MSVALKKNSFTTDFSSWLKTTRSELQNKKGIDVPCGSCTACCTSSYFIHIAPEEEQTLASIPQELLFPAPGLPNGNMVMGFDEKGHCPMLKDNTCSIYENRPLTCRTYDCRVFAACNLSAGGKEKQLINEKASQWQFSFSKQADKQLLDAVKMAAFFLLEHSKKFPARFVPGNNTQLAILAIKVHKVFLQGTGKMDDIVTSVIKAANDFKTGTI